MISPLARAILLDCGIELRENPASLVFDGVAMPLLRTDVARLERAFNRMVDARTPVSGHEGDATKVMRLLDRLFTPREAAVWLCQPHALFQGRTPVSVFGDDPARVVALLEELLSEDREHDK